MFTSTKSKKQPPASKAIAHNLQKKSPGNYSLKNLSIQTNLTIGNPNDKYEQEADRSHDHARTNPSEAVRKGGNAIAD